MDLIYTPNLERIVSGSNILIDTCVLIESSKNEQIDRMLSRMRQDGCTFLTVSSVKDEYTCGARDLREYEELSTFFDRQDILFVPRVEEKMLTSGIKFNIALSRSKVRNPSYTDKSLLFVPYIYNDSAEKPYVMTLNHKDVPRDFYDLAGFISYEKDCFHTIGIYSFNAEKFNNIIRNI